MKHMPFSLQGKGGIRAPTPPSTTAITKTPEITEPRSVLDHHRSPSPPTSTSTLGETVASITDHALLHQWPSSDWDLHPLPPDLAKPISPLSMDHDWDSILSSPSPSSFLKWVISDSHHHPPSDLDPSPIDPSLVFEPINTNAPLPHHLPPVLGVSDSISTLPLQPNSDFTGGFQLNTHIFPFPPPLPVSNPQTMLNNNNSSSNNNNSNPSVFLPFSTFPNQPLQIQPQFYGKARPDEPSAVIDQLTKVAEQIEARNTANAHGILARLNQLCSPHGKPLLRSAFYFKEALSALLESNARDRSPATPWDVVLKLTAYKAFSEVSPILHFTHFTCVQAILDEVRGCDRIHVVDFDIGVGGQWSSFMQELSLLPPTTGVPSLKITAFVSPSSHHPLELLLVRENLVHFASELGIPFEFNVMALDSFELAVHNLSSVGNEAVAVNVPVGSPFTSSSSFLRLVKQLSPKIVVSVDYGCDRSDLPFSQHFLHLLHSYTVLLDSIDAANAGLDVVTKIGRFLLQPRIENSVIGRYQGGDKMLHWRGVFMSSGFSSMSFSSSTETQAECLMKRTQTRGFQAEKRQSSLVLFWQRVELVSVTAWKC